MSGEAVSASNPWRAAALKIAIGVITSILIASVLWWGSRSGDTHDAVIKMQASQVKQYENINGRLKVLELQIKHATDDRYTGQQARAELALRDSKLTELERRVGSIEARIEDIRNRIASATR